MLHKHDPATAVAEERIARRNLHETVVSLLRDALVEGRMAPGERLNERLLCERFGISRTPLREAFKVLAAEGLLLLPPNRGAVVAPLTREDLEETTEVMAHLELLVGQKAAEALTDAQIDDIRRLHHQMCSAFLANEIVAYFKLNQSIHISLANASRNRVLAQQYESLNAKLKRYRYMANQNPERWRAAVAEHEEILRAIVARDGVDLGRILKQHLLRKAASIAGTL